MDDPRSTVPAARPRATGLPATRLLATTLAAFVALAVSGCERSSGNGAGKGSTTGTGRGDASANAAATNTEAPVSPFAAAGDAGDAGDLGDAAAAPADPADDEAYQRGSPKSAKSIGHTSVVFKVELSTGKKAVFKPASRRGPLRYKGEIAARRLAIALGLPNVPRVFARAIDANALSAATGSAESPAAQLFAKEVIVRDGVVSGALMPWIDGLSFLALEREPMASDWKRWLRRGEEIPAEQRELARQISTLVAFDYVTANWDRWSGGNVGVDKATGGLLYIDNDGAFFEVPPAESLQRNKRLLEGVDRFSRGFVTRLRELDDAAVATALGEERPGVPLLSVKALAGVARRRTELLQLVDAKRARAGDATLAFP